MSEQPLSFVHRFIPGSGKHAATSLLMLHGTGGDEDDLLDLGYELLPGAALLSPRGKVLEHGMPRFFRRLAEGVFDVADLQFRTRELADFIRDACVAYSLDSRRLIGVGYSNGANIAASMFLLRPETLVAAVLFRPMVPFVPSTIPDLTEKSILIAAGEADPIATPDQSQRLADLFSNAGAQVTRHSHRGGHELGSDDLTAAQTWLAKLPVTDK